MVVHPARSLIDDEDHETAGVLRMWFECFAISNPIQLPNDRGAVELYDRVVEPNADDGFRLIRDDSGRPGAAGSYSRATK